MRPMLSGALLTITALAAAGANDGHAAEETLNYQLVVHLTDTHTIDAPLDDGHAIGVAAFRGLAIFDDGSIANHWYWGSFDFHDGSGRFEGYALWAFDDGSELRSSYSGEAEATERGITFEGRHEDITGTKTYADVEGEGQFTGERVDHLDEGGDTYQRGTLKLRRPD